MTMGDRIPATRRPDNNHTAAHPESEGHATPPRTDSDSGHSRIVTPRAHGSGPHPAAENAHPRSAHHVLGYEPRD